MDFHSENDLHHIVSPPIVSLVLTKLASLKTNLYTLGCTKRPNMGNFSILVPILWRGVDNCPQDWLTEVQNALIWVSFYISAHIVEERGQLSTRLAYRSTESPSVWGKTC